jgi:hypothetical protein
MSATAWVRLARLEPLEPRLLLSSSMIGAIPSSIDPLSATQTLLAPGTSRWTIPADPSGSAVRLLRFTSDSLDFASPAHFDLQPLTLPGSGDAALALYDNNGNLLQAVDQDAGAVPGIESLAASLQSRRTYILGVYFAAAGPPVDYRLDVTLDQQLINVPPTFNPATGVSIPTGSHPEDMLSSPADIDYYPLDLLNAGPSGTVTITPTGLDTSAAATLFRQNGNGVWLPIASGADPTGGVIVLSITPPAQQSIADGKYMLAVTSNEFASAGAYQVQVNTAPVLGPANLPSLAGLVDLGTPPPVSFGIAGVDEAASLVVGGQRLYRFRAPTSGLVELTLQTAAFDPVLSLYNAAGTSLLAVQSRTAPGTTELSFHAIAGQQYVIRVGDVGNNYGGAFDLGLRTVYQAVPFTLSGTVTTTSISIGAGQPATILRIQSPLSNILAFEVDPLGNPVASRIVAVMENLSAAGALGSPGQVNFLAMEKNTGAGAIDVFISASAGGGDVTLRIGQLAVPKTLPLNHFTARKIDPVTGNLPPANQSAGNFGNLTGVQFHQTLIPPNQPSALAVQGLNGARPLVVHYTQHGSQLKLAGFGLPDNSQLATRDSQLSVNHVHAVAAVALGMNGTGVHQFNLNGPAPLSVGVGMVPDPPPPTWQDPVAPGPYFSALKIRDIELKFDYEQDLWHTLLPQNLVALPTISFTPTSNPTPASGLAATITVYKTDFTQSLTSFTNTPGQQAQVQLSGMTLNELRGARILFRIEPLAGQLGDGLYTLEMRVETTNPAPFEVREDHWINPFDPPNPMPPGQFGVFPLGTQFIDIVQDQDGNGSIPGSMTSSSPNTLGSLDVYRFQVQTPGPISIRTRPVAFFGPGANTNIKLYRPVLKPDGTFHYLTQVEDVPVSFDWFPADRSEIDAQIHVADFDLLQPGGWFYVVAKNQEGSTGFYQIEVETTTFPSLGSASSHAGAKTSQTTYIPTTGGSASINAPYVESFFNFVGYFPVQLPDYHNGMLSVLSGPTFDGSWDMALFTADGTRLPGTVEVLDPPTQIGYRTQGMFTVPQGPQVLFLRLGEKGNITNDRAFFTLNASVTLPPGFTAPETTFVPQPAFPLPTDPFAGLDGFTDSMTFTGQQKRFAFRAAAGPMTINVSPELIGSSASVILRWAVYVDGTLRAWDQTRVVDGQLDAESLTTTLLLPQFRSATPDPNYSFDRSQDNPYHDVVIVVRAMSAPVGGGNYSISIDAPRPLPMMEHGFNVALSPTVTNPSATATLRGIEWLRLRAPDGISGNVSFLVQFLSGSPAANTPVRYDIYDGLGQLVTSGTTLTFSQFGEIRAAFSPPQVTGGSLYHIRVAVAAEAVNANAFVNMTITASASLPKASVLPPLLNHALLSQWVRPENQAVPSGQFQSLNPVRVDPVNHPTLQDSNHFWVETGGPSRIRVPTQGQPGTVAVYSMFKAGAAEFPHHGLALVDYARTADPADPGFFVLDLFLDPGAYVVKVFRPTNTSTQSTPATIHYSLPAYPVIDLVLDPNFGSAAMPHLWGSSTARSIFASPPMESFRTVFYRAVAPGGALGPITVTGVQLVTVTGGEANEANRANIWLLSSSGNNLATDFLDPPGKEAFSFSPITSAQPFQEFYVRLNRSRLAGKTAAGIEFEVPFSGTPDLVVGEVQLLPDNGKTRVEVELFNIGYAPAGLSYSRFTTTDTSKVPEHVLDAILTELPMGPVSSRLKVFTWIPMRPEDQASFTADVFDDVEELDETNNHQFRLLSTVNKFRPVVQVQLADPQMTGHPATNTWGRYLAGVDAITNVIINISDGDGAHDLHNGQASFPLKSHNFFGSQSQLVLENINFGDLLPTGPNNSNIFKVFARDRFGLLSDEVKIVIDVKPFPGWLNDGTSTIVFNYNTRRYDFHFRNTLLEKGGTIDSLVGANIPLIGGKQNLFKAEISARGSASLNPNTPISAPVTGYVLIKILGATVLEETWAGQGQINSHLMLSTNVQIDSKTVDATQLNVTFRLMNLNLFSWTSPKITLLAYGIPNVASINAFLQFSVSAQVDAAITLALDPAALQNPLLPKKIGLASPTYIEPSITAGLTIGGSVEVIGFDLASITGTVNFKLALAYGLTTPPSEFVEFVDFFAKSNLNITGTLWGTIKAKVLMFTVFEFDFPSLVMNLTGGPPVVKNSNLLDGLAEVAALEDQLSTIFLSNMPEPVIPGGNEPVGTMEFTPSPNIVIHPATGHGRYVQVVDTNPGPEIHGNLAVSSRTGSGGAWSGQTILTSARHVSNPVLALTNDGANAPAVVVYQSLTPVGNLSNMTRNQFLTGQDLRYRYFNGTSWSAEQVITSDSLYDFDHAVAFNNSGQGVLAWVRNTSAAPINAEGHFNRDANEIMTSVWNPVTHTWSAPLAMTNDAVADGKPAVYVDETGKLYVLWLKDTPTGNQIMFRTYQGGVWSAAAVLPVNGLPAAGKVGSLAIGTEQAGRINVLMTHAMADPQTGEIDSRLYSRATTLAGFTQPAGVVEVARDTTFSHLRTTNAPDGALVAYWQHGNGLTNEVYAAHKSAGAPWAEPVRLSADAELSFTPSLAIDTDGTHQLVYEMQEAPKIGFWDEVPRPDPLVSPAIGLPASGGVVTGSLQPLPEFGFTRGLHFHEQDDATAGQTAIGRATILNSGLAVDDVLVEFLHGDIASPVVVGSVWVKLAPGSSYEASHPFPVNQGENQYHIRLTSAGGVEAISLDDNLSSATLTGLPDVEVVSLVSSDPEPQAGETVNLTATIRNNSNQPLSSVRVAFFNGDPHSTLLPAVQFAVIEIDLLPFETRQINLPWTLPAGAGHPLVTVWADPGNQINESNEFNNWGYLNFSTLPDPAVVAGRSGLALSATVLDYSGVDNVQVQANVANLGQAPVNDLRVALLWSLDDEDFQQVGLYVIDTLPPWQSVSVDFIADGLAGLTGHNRYRVIVDPGLEHPDADWSNNVAETLLIIQGLPDLAVEEFTLDPSSGFKQGMPLTLRSRIYNLGIATAEQITVEVLAHPGGFGFIPGFMGTVIGRVVVDRLDPLSHIDLEILLDTSQLSGGTEIALVIDRQQQILETTDQNNVVTQRVFFEFESREHLGSRFDDHWYVRRGDRGLVYIWHNRATTEPPSFTHLFNDITSLSFFGGEGNDRLTIDFSMGNPVPAGGVVFEAGLHLDQLVIVGTAQADVVQLNAGQIVVNGSVILFESVEQVYIYSGDGDDTVTATGNVPPLFFAGGSGNNTLNLQHGTFSFSYDLGSVSSNLTLNVLQSIVNLSGTQRLARLTIADSPMAPADAPEPVVRLSPSANAMSPGVLVTGSLDIAPASRLDLANNALIVDYAGTNPLDQVNNWIKSGSAGGTWNGFGIMSSSIAGNSSFAIGIGDNAVLGRSSFLGHAVDSTTIYARFTLGGDANLDGEVNIADLGILAANWQGTGKYWFHGDSNYDGLVNIADLGILAANWQKNLAASPGIVIVEEVEADSPQNPRKHPATPANRGRAGQNGNAPSIPAGMERWLEEIRFPLHSFSPPGHANGSGLFSDRMLSPSQMDLDEADDEILSS